MNNVVIRRGCKLHRVIIDKHVVIQPGTVIGHDPEEDANRFETTEDGIVVISKGAEIGRRPQDSGNHFRVGRIF